MFVQSVAGRKIYTVEMALTLTIKKGQGQMQIYHSKSNKRLNVLAMVMFTLSVTIGELITFNLPPMARIEFRSRS